MAQPSLNAKGPSWPIRTLRKLNPFASRIEPEEYSQSQKLEFNRFGIAKPVRTKSGSRVFGEIEGANQFNIDRPGAGITINPEKALANNRGFVYAAMNAIAREVMTIDWRLFQTDGEDHEEVKEHDVLDLLDTVNDSMISLAFKYLLSACLTLTGNCYVYLEGVKSDTDEPKALHLMPPDRVRPVIDRRSWPYQLVAYKMKLETIEMAFRPYEIIQLQLPNPSNFFEGMSPVQAGAEYIDNDNYAQEFNRKFFKNGARPAGFLETDFVAETQLEVLKVGFANLHQGIDNMQGIGVLPKGVKWATNGASPKDMDFKNLSEDSKARIMAIFGVSKTILGTAESDTNRSTAETADYVFSKRVVKPHMLLICAYLTEKLLPRYGDNLYLSFIDPVPEDRAARTTEMTSSVGAQPVLTVNEAREQFMGEGPVDGGDVLMKPNTMGPATAQSEPEPKPGTDAENAKALKRFNTKRLLAKLAYVPPRTRLKKIAAKRKKMQTDLAAAIKDAVTKAQASPGKFSTKAMDEAAWMKFSEHTANTERQIAAEVRKLNALQKKEVLEHLPTATKAVDPTKLFDKDKWISIMTDALTPAITQLFISEAETAAAEVGKPELVPLSDIAAREALHKSISMMSESYQQTTLETLEAKINDGLSQGQSLAQISKTVEDVYEWSDTFRAERVAKTEAFRTSNMALKETWKQSGVVKTVRWYTTENANVCPYCQELDGKVISIDANFLNEGETLTAGDKTMTANYGDVSSPPLHPLCSCFLRPDSVEI